MRIAGKALEARESAAREHCSRSPRDCRTERVLRQVEAGAPGARIVGDTDTLRRVRDAIQNPSHDPGLLVEHPISIAAAERFRSGEWNDFTAEREHDIVTWEADVVSDIGLRPITSAEQDD